MTKEGEAGLIYRGPFIFRQDDRGERTLEGVECPEGKLTAEKAYIYIKDHLGSVVSVVNGTTGEVVESSEYDAYGRRTQLQSSGDETESRLLREHFTGKEDQMPEFGIDYTDFGARLYSPTVRRWLTPDPLSEKYYGISPYAYCAGNPVNFIDPDGKRPIYNKFGDLVGVTESGLQGPPLVIPEYKKFVRLSDDEAELMDKGTDGLCDPMAYKRFFDSYTMLDTRPDWDGYITLDEANEWYRHATGKPLYADFSKVDLSKLKFLSEGGSTKGKTISLFKVSNTLNDMLVYGTITIEWLSDNEIVSSGDFYDFDIKKGMFVRNIATMIGHAVAGNGVPYSIYFYGIKILE